MDSRKAAAVALAVLSVVCRVSAIFVGTVTILLCFPGVAIKLNLVSLVVDLSRTLPSAVAGWGMVASPFGGVFRLDFALLMVALFVLDWVFDRASRSFRSR